MGDKKKNPDILFRDALAGHRIRPDEKVWEQLSERLDQRKKRALPIWIKWAAGLLLLLGLTWIFYFLTGLPDTPQKMTAEEAPFPQVLPPVLPGEIEASKAVPMGKGRKTAPEQEQSKQLAAADGSAAASKRVVEETKSFPKKESFITEVPKASVRTRLEAISAPKVAAEELLVKQPPSLTNDSGPEATETYTVRIVSRGYALQPEKEKLVEELETKIGGFISRVDEGFGDLQDAKNTLFASLTTKKTERKTTK